MNRNLLRAAVLVLSGALGSYAGAAPRGMATQDAKAGAETQAPKQAAAMDPGARVYAKNCAICHGDERQGNLPAFPPLVGIKNQLSDAQITTLVHTGKGRMPSFPNLQGGELASLLKYLGTPGPSVASAAVHEKLSGLAASGEALFHQNCAFCHGRDAMGGETGPDLTQSKLVLSDKSGEKISQVVREGRPQTKMPAFNFSSEQLASLVAFIHARVEAAAKHPGGRRGVSPADLQTGNVEEGKAYFNGKGGCARCHSATGDLAGVATRYQGLQLEERMLYPRGAKSTLTVTLPSGKKLTGPLSYRDEFTIGMWTPEGYRSWRTDRVQYTIDSPADAHAEQFPKYTDADVHNLMAYLQTLK